MRQKMKALEGRNWSVHVFVFTAQSCCWGKGSSHPWMVRYLPAQDALLRASPALRHRFWMAFLAVPMSAEATWRRRWNPGQTAKPWQSFAFSACGPTAHMDRWRAMNVMLVSCSLTNINVFGSLSLIADFNQKWDSAMKIGDRSRVKNRFRCTFRIWCSL